MKTILKYLRKYWLPALLASAFMIAEVYVDLYQPRMMAVIVDEGILGVGNNGVSNLSLILSTGGGKSGLEQLFDMLNGTIAQNATLADITYEQAKTLSFMKN